VCYVVTLYVVVVVDDLFVEFLLLRYCLLRCYVVVVVLRCMFVVQLFVGVLCVVTLSLLLFSRLCTLRCLRCCVYVLVTLRYGVERLGVLPARCLHVVVIAVTCCLIYVLRSRCVCSIYVVRWTLLPHDFLIVVTFGVVVQICIRLFRLRCVPLFGLHVVVRC